MLIAGVWKASIGDMQEHRCQLSSIVYGTPLAKLPAH
jgi:LytS/YehU family sensor histidine kinase